MAEQSVAVIPGQTVQVAASLAAGTTLYNGDATAALWVSSAPTPGQGSGFRIGPQGSVNWATSGPCYAAVDAGVTRTLTLTVTDSITAPVDPVSVGAAVAAQLLAQGVPSVLTGEDVPVVNLGTPVDVSRYASLTVNIYVTAATLVRFHFNTAPALPYNEVGGGEYVMAGAGWLTFTTDVTGPWFSLETTTPGALFRMNLYGTNRALGTVVRNVSSSIRDGVTRAWAVGDGYTFATPLITGGGLHRLRLATTANLKGYLSVTTWDPTASAVSSSFILDTGMGHASPQVTTGITEVQDNVILPAGQLVFTFTGYTSATAQVLLSVIPTP